MVEVDKLHLVKGSKKEGKCIGVADTPVGPLGRIVGYHSVLPTLHDGFSDALGATSLYDVVIC